MNKFTALVTKEMRIYFNSPIAYIFLVTFLSFSSWFFFRTFFLLEQAEVRGLFGILPWVFLFLIPALTMRIWAEEYRQGTIETLLTSSVTLNQTVFAKALACFVFLLLSLLLTLSIPITVSLIGPLDWGVVFTAYAGALLLGSSYIALGLFMSALTNNQIVAFILTVIIAFGFFIIGEPFVTFSLPGGLASLLEFLGLGAHYGSIMRGVIDSRDIVYYISFIGLFLYLNKLILETKR